MQEQMSGFDIRRICSEFDEFIGAHCKKSYQPHHEQIVLRIKPKDKPQIDIIIVRGKRIYASNRDRLVPRQPSAFAMILRKYLSNARLISVKQHNFDRVLIFDFEGKSGYLKLVVECFRNGNVILLDENEIVIQPLTHTKYQDRVLKRGMKYKFPPPQTNPYDLDSNTIKEILEKSDKELARTLAAKANLGNRYANALCIAAKLDPNALATDIAKNNQAINSIFSYLKKTLEELSAEGNLQKSWLWMKHLDSEEISIPELSEKNTLKERDDFFEKSVIEATPVRNIFEEDGLTCIEFGTLWEAIDAWRGRFDCSAHQRSETEKMERGTDGRPAELEQDKLKRRLITQKKSVEKFSEDISKFQIMADKITENWGFLDDLITQVSSFVNNEGWNKLKPKIKEIIWIKSFNAAEQTLKVVLPDEKGEISDILVDISISESVHQNAQRYYKKARKIKEKYEGAKSAIMETEAILSREIKKKEKSDAKGKVVSVKRQKKLWFEKYKWTIVENMRFLIGGKDAKSNDTLVKKHLKTNDLYFHADLHGAPSCVLKFSSGLVEDQYPPEHLPEGIPAYRLSDSVSNEEFKELAIKQSAQMSLIWSRGWNGGGGAGTAFWAKPSQVSKTAETGEYLTKGAFIVRGKRNWIKDLEMKVCIGLICINGIPFLIGGTSEIISSVCERWAEVIPSSSKKDKLANKIAKLTGIPTDDILPVLPGNCKISANHGLFIEN